MTPPIVAVIGNKKSGKTTLVVKLLAELRSRGRRVMSVKHGHDFRFDTPGTDSWRHVHEGGAERVVLVGPDQVAMAGRWGSGGEPRLQDLVARHLPEAELVVAEGFRREPVPTIEIFRSGIHPAPITPPSAMDAARHLAVVTDRRDLPWPCPAFDPDDPALARRLADLVERRLLAPSRGGGPEGGST